MLLRDATLQDSAAVARILVDTWRQAYADIMPSDFLAGLSYQAREKRIREGFLASDLNRFMVVSEENSVLVGCMVGGACRDESEKEYHGEVYTLYVLPGHQSKGIGMAIVRAGVERLLAMGYNTMLIWVLSKNPARGFYEALGAGWPENGKWKLTAGCTRVRLWLGGFAEPGEGSNRWKAGI